MAHGPRYGWANETLAGKIAALQRTMASERHGVGGDLFYQAGILDILADMKRRLPPEQPSYPRYDLIADYQMRR